MSKNLLKDQKVIRINNFSYSQVQHPYLSPLVDLSRVDTMFGLSERIIATESL